MTTQTDARRPADATIPYPAIHDDDTHTWKPATSTKELLVSGAIALAFIAASIYVQFISETAYVLVIARVIDIPVVIFTGLGALIALAVFALSFKKPAAWYQEWSFVEVREEEAGIRLFVGRLGADHTGVLVRSGEQIEIAGKPGKEQPRETDLTVTAPAGKLEVHIDYFIEGVTAQPLLAAAAKKNITVSFAGVATEIKGASA
ncbi:MAG: hypothetical protein GX593_13100 [Actinomycetales bacterium]|nr:hypothetical protein [Actinomycetales bacterium]